MSVRIELRRDAGKIDRTTVWIRRQQVARVLGPPDPASVAELVDHRGRVVGHGLYSPESKIVLRLLSSGDRAPGPDWLTRRLAAALAGRAALGLGRAGERPPRTTGLREVNSEGDNLPGLVVDRFGDWRVVQITTAPMAVRRHEIARWLREHAPLSGGEILLLPESAAEREGFEPGVELLPSPGADAPTQLEWLENGRTFVAPAPPAQKTGAYHDQRDNRSRFAELCSQLAKPDGATVRVLDLGCHVGGFAIAAAQHGASVVAVDQSTTALEYLRRNAIANAVSERIETVAADMFGELDLPALAGPFDAMIVDPPKIVTSRRDLPRAERAMGRMLARLLPRLRESGLLGVCSCSHHLGWEQLDRVVLEAADKLPLVRLARWGAGLDHPIAPGHEQGEYLRVVVYQRRARVV
jgi:23S rRNA (cytosine1962-C5)-methyltransferase